MIRYVVASEAPQWLSGWVGLAVAILGALGLLASAAAYLRASYAKATVATLVESNTALRSRLDDLEQERRDESEAHRAQLANERRERLEVVTRLEALERENGTLREVVQGKADVERLVMLIQDHHHEVIEDRKAFHVEWRGEIDKMQATTDDVLTAVGEVATSQKAIRGMVGKVYASTVGERT